MVSAMAEIFALSAELGVYLPMILSASLQPDSIAPWTVEKCLQKRALKNYSLLFFVLSNSSYKRASPTTICFRVRTQKMCFVHGAKMCSVLLPVTGGLPCKEQPAIVLGLCQITWIAAVGICCHIDVAVRATGQRV